MDKKELTPMQKARRKYEDKNIEERKKTRVQFTTSLSREFNDEIIAFLKKRRITKVQLIYEGYEALKKMYEALNKK